jgi:hypothetical protein
VWTRRDLLRAAGVGAAASALASLGCGRGAVATVPAPEARALGLRAALRDAAALIATRLREPVAYAQVRRRVRAAVDLIERDVDDRTTARVVLAGRGADGRWRERALDRTEPALVLAAARALIVDAPAGASAELASGAPIDHAPELATDPELLTIGDWRARADDLATRGEARSNSRVVYRAAYLVCDDERSWVVSADGDRFQRLVRTRMGAVAVAWHGNAPAGGAVEVAGGFGPEPTRLSTEALATANTDALALTTPGVFTAIRGPVVLSPTALAAVIDRAWSVAPGGGAVVDAPAHRIDDAPAYASYFFDALGVDRAAAGPHRRRGGPDARLTTAPSNLVLAPGDVVELNAAAGDGYVVDGIAEAGGQGDELALRATRVRRIAGGKLTGHAWRDVELRGAASAMVAGITARGVRATTVAIDDGGPARAVITPAAVTVATLVPARGPA